MQHRYLKNVVTLSLDTNQCVGCGMCADVCPHGVFTVNDRIAHIQDKDLCMECGACAKNCPPKAIIVDAGVGCAYAFIMGWFTGKEPNCSCPDDDECC
jgi:ferredoxin